MVPQEEQDTWDGAIETTAEIEYLKDEEYYHNSEGKILWKELQKSKQDLALVKGHLKKPQSRGRGKEISYCEE